MKRAYKLQEFVAHGSCVSCLKIGRKSPRMLVTGGEDHRVNMWAIGKPNALASLSGHSSAVESVTFDSAESLVVAGAASGTVKLWDLEEAKILRTLTGHRSNCIALDFHPFGEFFASGSLDTNLKVWDIRRKGCIHTYKGHSGGVNCLKFSPDGRWVVSGGEDNIVKLWDLTAGKLMHDFKHHDDQILSLDFHPHEFLLASGSCDRTVKFYDLETFELIGSSAPEASGVGPMMFSPDGRTLLCALSECLKVLSWEPFRCHDAVDVHWSKLADINVHERKLLACSLNQNSVGVWVVDLSRVNPFQAMFASRANGVMDNNSNNNSNSNKSLNVNNSAAKTALAESALKDSKILAAKTTEHVCLQRVNTPIPSRIAATVSAALASTRKRSQVVDESTTMRTISGSAHEDFGPNRSVIKLSSLRKSSAQANTDRCGETDFVSRPEALTCASRMVSDRNEQCLFNQSDVRHERNISAKDDRETFLRKGSGKLWRDFAGRHGGDSLLGRALADADGPPHSRHTPSYETSAEEGGRQRHFDTKERLLLSIPLVASRGGAGKYFASESEPFFLRKTRDLLQQEATSPSPANDVLVIGELTQQRSNITTILQSRLAKLQVVRRYWAKSDLKAAIEAMAKMDDNAVLVDGLSILIERSDLFTLEIFALLLPLLNNLLRSEIQRHLLVAISFTAVLVRNFGVVIHDTMATTPTLGVDLQAERRLERCNACYKQLQVFRQGLKPLLRRNGEIAKAASDLNLALRVV